MIPPGENWGPFSGAISHGERVARLRALRAITQLYCGTLHPLVKALWLAESGDAADLAGALAELDAMPALTRRRVLGSYATHQAYKAQRDAGDGRPMPARIEGGRMMAGGGIELTPLEVARIRRLVVYPERLATWLTCLDEDGWRAAQELLADYARRDAEVDRAYQQSQTEGNTP